MTTRPAVLAAAVEIYLAAGDVAAARTASDELSHLAGVVDAPMLHAIADGAAGSVLAAEGDAAAALIALRRALSTWGSLRVPYEMARVRLGIAMACTALGDDEATRSRSRPLERPSSAWARDPTCAASMPARAERHPAGPADRA